MPKAATFKPLTNRSAEKGGKFKLPDDGFVMLVPKGEAPNVMDDGSAKGKRIIQVVDDEALGLIMNKLLNRGGDEMLIDDEHFSHDSDKATDANGWQPLEKDSLQNRADGLYGDPRWSTKGLENVEGGVKRYVSPEFGTSTLQPLGGNRYRVTELTGLALTNRPGFRKLQKPLTNRDADGGIETANTNTMHKALLAGLLGITEIALDALDEPTLKNRVSVIKEDAAKAGALKTELDTLHNREADEFIAKHDKVIPKKDTVRDHLKKTFLANRQMAEDLVAGYSEDDGEKLTDEQKRRAESKPMFNRDKAKGPEADTVLKNRQLERAGKIKNRAAAICEERRIAGKPADFNSAWAAAESEFPEA
jgi:phage I-like protein